MYAIRETHGSDWWSAVRGWTPASDEATTFETREEAEETAEEECQARTVRVVDVGAA